MKKVVVACLILFCVLSCSKKEQYYGTWTLWNSPSFDEPYIMKITEDSIFISDYGSQWNAYPVTIKNNSLTFLGQTFITKISKDSLVFESITYKRDTIPQILEVNLPELKNYSFKKIEQEENTIFIYYGKKPNSNEYALQLNDKYADFSDLSEFTLDRTSCAGNYRRELRKMLRIVLLCDKNAKINDLEDIFAELTYVNNLSVYNVNNITDNIIKDSSSLRIKQDCYYQNYKIPFIYNPNYYSSKHGIVTIPYHYYKEFFFNPYSKPKDYVYAFLVNNQFYFEKKMYAKDDFTTKIQEAIETKIPLVMLYDLESDFEHLMLFNAIHDEAFFGNRNKSAFKHFRKSMEELERDQIDTIVTMHPYTTIHNFSIPHFLSFEETPNDSIPFPFKNIKQRIPEAYFSQPIQ